MTTFKKMMFSMSVMALFSFQLNAQEASYNPDSDLQDLMLSASGLSMSAYKDSGAFAAMAQFHQKCSGQNDPVAPFSVCKEIKLREIKSSAETFELIEQRLPELKAKIAEVRQKVLDAQAKAQ